VEILPELSAGHFGAVEALSTRGWFTAAGDYTQ